MLISYFQEFGFDKDQIIDVERILFADFTGNRDAEVKPYTQIDDLQGLVNKMDQFQ